MAESVGEPVTNSRPIRRYDWDTWFARPFKAWVVTQGADFDVTLLQMQRTITTTAWRRGHPVAVSARDPIDAGRIWFCGYEQGDPKPKAWVTSSFTMPEGSEPAASYVCAICGKQRPIIPWFARYGYDDDDMAQVVLECIEETGVGTYTAPHRSDMPLPVVDDYGYPVGWDWNKETGPVAKGYGE